jgi:predicted nucleotidyltransferase
MAGSRASGKSDAASDIDLYVYVTDELTLQQRESVSVKATRKEIGNAFWNRMTSGSRTVSAWT